jgi:hypothetical protein
MLVRLTGPWVTVGVASTSDTVIAEFDGIVGRVEAGRLYLSNRGSSMWLGKPRVEPPGFFTFKPEEGIPLGKIRSVGSPDTNRRS